MDSTTTQVVGTGGTTGVEQRNGTVTARFDTVLRSSDEISHGWYGTWGKRGLDVVLCVMAFPFFAVLFAAGWSLLRLSLGPGVILRQRRIGRNGEAYDCLKFRTMRPDRRRARAPYDGPERRVVHKTDADPRHTRIGRCFRKHSIDELPQFWNVLRGDMSLVGPRPEMESQANAEFIAHPRHLVRPGLTGPFQISELRSGGNLRAGLDLDHGYVQEITLRRDLALLRATVGAIRRGTGS